MEDYGDHTRPSTSSTPKFADDEVLVDANPGSFAQRRPSKRGRNGFNAPKNNMPTPRFRTTSPPLASPMVPSPCLTIPPGISPTVLLDSPIMLLNTQVRFLFSCISVLGIPFQLLRCNYFLFHLWTSLIYYYCFAANSLDYSVIVSITTAFLFLTGCTSFTNLFYYYFFSFSQITMKGSFCFSSPTPLI